MGSAEQALRPSGQLRGPGDSSEVHGPSGSLVILAFRMQTGPQGVRTATIPQLAGCGGRAPAALRFFATSPSMPPAACCCCWKREEGRLTGEKRP